MTVFKVRLVSAGLALALLCSTTIAQAQAFSERSLLAAMEARTEYGEPLRALKRDGYLSARPQNRSNYDDFYRPLRAFRVMGAKVVVVQENYLGRYVGCCADPGIGLYFESADVATLNGIRDFATTNKCIYLQGNALIAPELPRAFLRFKANTFYAMLRCSDGDERRASR
jgi:hypothetical protein